MEEENTNPTDPNVCSPDTDGMNQDSSDDSLDNEAIVDFRNRMIEQYKGYVYYIDLINQAPKRKVNLSMRLTQMFGRYDKKQAIVFLAIAFVLAVIQGAVVYWGFYPWGAFTLGVLLTVLTSAFVFVTLIHVYSALKDLKLLKNGYCSIGYQIALFEVLKKTPDNSYPEKIMVVYKDSVDMIRTLEIQTKQNCQYFVPPVLMLFVDRNNPYEVAFSDTMPYDIEYNDKLQMFVQDWKGSLYTLVPVGMLVLYAISISLCCAAYTMMH